MIALLIFLLATASSFDPVHIAPHHSSSSAPSASPPSHRTFLTSSSAPSASPPSRRTFLSSSIGAALLPLLPAAAPAAETRQGIAVTPLNAATNTFNGADFNGAPAPEGVSSIPYSSFLEALTKGEVAFVRFLAPDGDVAFATMKEPSAYFNKGEPLRIGEGMPLEQHRGYSTPLFVVRSVKDKGVPYTFEVPAMAKFRDGAGVSGGGRTQ
ncbi:hypothetical protein TeGR_g623 [Tetraparma gracilis]|uniref:Uncharacterized protein n=1 Tax=Tetraparma gracilis TaxID=2962635 RepID=A0ABQ6MIY3_9STRA|nr:hypothetical protein TeGR_g623 [Tetraparma gracilis]